MQGDLEETVGIAGQRVSRRLWEAEIVLRCAAWVAGIHGATLLGLGIVSRDRVFEDAFLPMRVERILAGTAMLGASALILYRRRKWAIFSTAVLHLLYTVYHAVAFILFLGGFGGGLFLPEGESVRGQSIVVCFLRGVKMLREGVLTLPRPYLVMLAVPAILLPIFVALAVLGRSAKEAFSPAFRGTSLAPISSCHRSGASVRVWAALGGVGLSLVYLGLILLL